MKTVENKRPKFTEFALGIIIMLNYTNAFLVLVATMLYAVYKTETTSSKYLKIMISYIGRNYRTCVIICMSRVLVK